MNSPGSSGKSPEERLLINNFSYLNAINMEQSLYRLGIKDTRQNMIGGAEIIKPQEPGATIIAFMVSGRQSLQPGRW